MVKNIIVLISGNGSNLQAFIDACGNSIPNGRIAAVISNKHNAFGLQRALNAGINSHCLAIEDYKNRQDYDQALATLIDIHQPDVIILAGFMRILSPEFVLRYQGKIVNIHPSILPKYPGLHTHQRAIEAKDKEHGASVHFVTADLDSGPIILQKKIPILKTDTAASLALRLLTEEHIIYPIAVNWLIEDRLSMQDGKAIFDGKILGASGVIIED